MFNLLRIEWYEAEPSVNSPLPLRSSLTGRRFLHHALSVLSHLVSDAETSDSNSNFRTERLSKIFLNCVRCVFAPLSNLKSEFFLALLCLHATSDPVTSIM